MNNSNHSRTLATRLFAAALVLACASTMAGVRYVDVNSTNATPPYGSWTTAATNIQDAVDIAVAGDEIVVTNGVYATGGRAGNRVIVDKPLRLRSVNGPQVTIIDGGHSVRCVYLPNDANLSGFTVTSGATDSDGPGILAESQTAVVSNCVVSSNVCRWSSGGGAYGATLNKCTLFGNAADYGGGAASCTLNSCLLSNNLASTWGALEYDTGKGGGALECTLINCVLTSNRAYAQGGGASSSILNNCTLTGNTAAFNGGGASGGALNNCTLVGNFPEGASPHQLFCQRGNCGVVPVTLNNCIVYFNGGRNYDSSSTLNYSCTTPFPTNGVGNITNAPLFVNKALGKLRLQLNSPCIDTGFNGYAPGDRDLAGCPRISGGSVDMGAYEFQSIAHIPPPLTITSSGNETILGWPAYAPGFDYTGFTLLNTTNVAFRTGGWNIVHPRPVAVNGQFLVTNVISGSQSFFRLFLGACDMNQDCPSCLRCIIPFGANFGTCSVYATCNSVVSCSNDDF